MPHKSPSAIPPKLLATPNDFHVTALDDDLINFRLPASTQPFDSKRKRSSALIPAGSTAATTASSSPTLSSVSASTASDLKTPNPSITISPIVYPATDGSQVRVLADARGKTASLAEFTHSDSTTGKSAAVKHKSVYETWYCKQGRGILVTFDPKSKKCTLHFIHPNQSYVIPNKDIFYWEKTSKYPLKILGTTIGPWPLGKKGDTEARVRKNPDILAKMKNLVYKAKSVQFTNFPINLFSLVGTKEASNGSKVKLLVNQRCSPKGETFLCAISPNQLTKPLKYKKTAVTQIEQVVYVMQGSGVVWIQTEEKSAATKTPLQADTHFCIPPGATFQYLNTHPSYKLILHIAITPSYKDAEKQEKLMVRYDKQQFVLFKPTQEPVIDAAERPTFLPPIFGLT